MRLALKMILGVGLLFLTCYLFLHNFNKSPDLSPAPKDIHIFFEALERRCTEYGWNDIQPQRIKWQSDRTTPNKYPLVFTQLGNSKKDCALLLAGVHGDELPPVYLLLRLARYIEENPRLFQDKCIVIAPLVNPDGFFAKPSTRVNANGVDINRNFPTKDWRQTRKDRYYSGPHANSESETMFQIALIDRFKPTHIISIHSPLGCYDYDGPSSNFDSIVIWLKKVSKENGLPFRRYQVFPGSLGNYAGMERKIHTLTLELPSSLPQKGAEYFDQFKSMFLDILRLNP